MQITKLAYGDLASVVPSYRQLPHFHELLNMKEIKKKYDLFIAYAETERPLVREMARRLASSTASSPLKKLRVFLPELHIGVGAEIES